MVWLMMPMENSAENFGINGDNRSKSEHSLSVFAIPDETDEEFADFMFSRKASAVLDE